MKKLLLLSAAMSFLFLNIQAAHAQMNDGQTTVREESTTDGDQHTTVREETNSDGTTVREVHHWVRGERLPNEYTDRQYRVSNWTEYHLHRPDPGYYWVHAENHYILVDGNGVITEVR